MGVLATSTMMISPLLHAAESHPQLPKAVTSFGAVTQNGWLYIYGGHMGERHMYSADDVSGEFYRLKLNGGKEWEKLASNTPAQSPVLVADERYVYRVGGMAAKNPKGQKQDLWSHESVVRFDSRGKKWTELASLPSPRSSHDGWIVDEKLYVVGGWTLAGSTEKSVWADTTLVLDLTKRNAKWKEIPQPFKRRGLCVAALGTKLYSIGGMDDGDATTLEVSVLDTTTGQWAKGPELPKGKLKGFGNSACVVDGRIYVSGLSGIVWRLNKAGDGWEEAGNLATARFFHRIVPGLKGEVLALGGESEEAKLRDIEVIPVSKPVTTAARNNP
jgi:N-acetylneuraminic acid mutarotase